MTEPDPIFVWRVSEVEFDASNGTCREKEVEEWEFSMFEDDGKNIMQIVEESRCQYCNSELKVSYNNVTGGKILVCRFCGWGKIKWNHDPHDNENKFQKSIRSPFWEDDGDIQEDDISAEDEHLFDLSRIQWELEYDEERYHDVDLDNHLIEKILRTFPIDSTQLSFSELGKYLQSNPNKFFNVSPRRIELLVGDIYRSSGYQVEVTKTTRDGGKDLILLSNGSDPTIVEVKRKKNNIEVDIVRRLRGVQLTYGHRSAILVATTGFTKSALYEANLPNAKKDGYDLKLIDMQDLLRMLDVYKANQTLASQIKRLKHNK